MDHRRPDRYKFQSICELGEKEACVKAAVRKESRLAGGKQASSISLVPIKS
ncbi:Hypothetical predicted protein [Podarcis lilfordi]|uniref:Uncharacterized protein n=1 Tax=Podarcis lilfordi TaxID=74358 RepID=A0AA35NVR3_9SAUR|nr:Hypothetical predicted protein [Podarcis lilfordi]